MRSTSYTFAAIGAYIIWGFIAFPLKGLSTYPSTQILFYRILMAFICLPVLLILFRRQAIADTVALYKASDKKSRLVSILAAIAGSLLLTANWLFFIYVVNQVSLQTASFAYLICPILTAFLGYALLKESLSPQQWLAVAISFISCAILGYESLGNMAFSLLIALSYALYLISQRYVKVYDKMVLLTLQVGMAFLLISCLGQGFRGVPPASAEFYGIVFVLSTVFTILPLFLNLFALKGLKSATVGILMYINPLVSFLVAFFAFNEQVSFIQWLAYLLIFLSVLLFISKIKIGYKLGNISG
ncbi:EamA family transporter [Rhodocytophaga aerolata]|uniref:EamA family transporter n=1 Tax=Rhodocytophaga aerolata TaxID=455078 RepID=A0ABT8R9L8_9BACT|nr:EamA family transporter [Rhodocytophaga aerolata]MDO1448044.1 EamA family transporter [Rhodocytophaga aerolata]